jgi:hypothetical protein
MEALVDGDLQTTLRALPDRLDRLLTTGDAVSPQMGAWFAQAVEDGPERMPAPRRDSGGRVAKTWSMPFFMSPSLLQVDR